MLTISNRGFVTGRILLGYFLLASNIVVQKWLLESYNMFEINFIIAGMFMIYTTLQELLTKGSLQKIKPVSWKILLLISFFTLVAWNFFLSALSGLSVFEFGAMSLLSPVVMATLAMLILGEKQSSRIWPAIGFGIAGGWFLIQAEWQGWSSSHNHAFMLGALVFSSLRWITVKFAGENVPTSAIIFWEPALVFVVMGSTIDLADLWDKITPLLFSSAVLLFLSRQCLVRSYQTTATSATSISTLIYTKVGWTLLFGYLFWGNLPEPLEWLGILLIIFSSWMIVFRGTPSSRSG
ncbi:MAG: DMT family transporter [Nitrospina sp.]|jgi:drug/metabolite transporter (DMT)-like permease|nr:DMT family transporter [Nitrospina sp.]MBT3676940.1 DMT family transporter [Candidatus Neomarinimicrobiota bacterium]MBT4662024.1 DMT family transporter [Candidatus Neomarinimicrobiota bacterium]MBT7014539.1 DMT family transporter [Actinomycetota bacterium]